MRKIYMYKLVTDNGGAPCVTDKLLSLAICKPAIRRTAERGSLIFGFAANCRNEGNRLIYAAEVDPIPGHDYYTMAKYDKRGDCIYEVKGGEFHWKPGAAHHGEDDVAHDLGDYPQYKNSRVLISKTFCYFGRERETRVEIARLISDAAANIGRVHRVNHPAGLREALELLWERLPRGKIGPPSDREDVRVCHRNDDEKLWAVPGD